MKLLRSITHVSVNIIGTMKISNFVLFLHGHPRSANIRKRYEVLIYSFIAMDDRGTQLRSWQTARKMVMISCKQLFT